MVGLLTPRLQYILCVFVLFTLSTASSASRAIDSAQGRKSLSLIQQTRASFGLQNGKRSPRHARLVTYGPSLSSPPTTFEERGYMRTSSPPIPYSNSSLTGRPSTSPNWCLRPRTALSTGPKPAWTATPTMSSRFKP
ncbi:hypothetical protein B0H13DRAFT_1972973 [Mycena leptocephala]|nr:hypothetical protein B0H13DRAFT_1972973 [Mycena leptocephala]